MKKKYTENFPGKVIHDFQDREYRRQLREKYPYMSDQFIDEQVRNRPPVAMIQDENGRTRWKDLESPEVWEELKKLRKNNYLRVSKTRYVTGIPRKQLRKGKVLVHNAVTPAMPLGTNGFRAWIQKLDNTLVLCVCDMAGADMRGLKHYRVKAAYAAAQSEKKKKH
jgi:hypothetical protein